MSDGDVLLAAHQKISSRRSRAPYEENLAHPLLRASVSTSELDSTPENLSLISSEDLVSVVEASLDLPFLQ